MTKRTPFFNAHAITIGTCPDPRCRSIHIELVDHDDEPHSQAVIDCDRLEDIIADLRAVRDRIVMGGEKKGLDN